MSRLNLDAFHGVDPHQPTTALVTRSVTALAQAESVCDADREQYAWMDRQAARHIGNTAAYRRLLHKYDRIYHMRDLSREVKHLLRIEREGYTERRHQMGIIANSSRQ